jgi:hypothetical protein
MLVPPDGIRDNPAKLQKWKPVVKRCIDWESLYKAEGIHAVGDTISSSEPVDDEPQQTDQEPELLTIGLIGVYARFVCR